MTIRHQKHKNPRRDVIEWRVGSNAVRRGYGIGIRLDGQTLIIASPRPTEQIRTTNNYFSFTALTGISDG
jgi:hypothetical protein